MYSHNQLSAKPFQVPNAQSEFPPEAMLWWCWWRRSKSNTRGMNSRISDTSDKLLLDERKHEKKKLLSNWNIESNHNVSWGTNSIFSSTFTFSQSNNRVSPILVPILCCSSLLAHLSYFFFSPALVPLKANGLTRSPSNSTQAHSVLSVID